jgi:threonyl-tRNA synthetase
MPTITLPDGSQRDFDQPVSVQDVAASIGPGLAKAALAGKVDGRLVDTSHVIDRDAALAIVTGKDEDALELLRHDAAHVMAQAVQELYPGHPGDHRPGHRERLLLRLRPREPFTPDDLANIEARMHEIVKRDLPIQREVWERRSDQVFGDIGEAYKAQIIQDIPGRRRSLRLPSGRLVRPLPRSARAQHRQARQGLQADEGGRRLLARRFAQRDAAAHLRHRLARQEGSRRPTCTAWKRRRSATTARSASSCDLFHMQEEAPGMVFWHPNGWTDLSGGRAVHARQAAATRLPGGAHAAGGRPQPVGEVRATGRSSGTTCSPPSPRTATTRSSR